MHSRTSTNSTPSRSGWAPLFDEHRLATRTGQHGIALRDFAALLLDHLPADLDALRSALRARRRQSVAKAAHKLAGTFAALAIDALVRDSIAIEEAADAGDLTHCQSLAGALETRCEQAIEELARFVATFG